MSAIAPSTARAPPPPSAAWSTAVCTLRAVRTKQAHKEGLGHRARVARLGLPPSKISRRSISTAAMEFARQTFSGSKATLVRVLSLHQATYHVPRAWKSLIGVVAIIRGFKLTRKTGGNQKHNCVLDISEDSDLHLLTLQDFASSLASCATRHENTPYKSPNTRNAI